MMNLQISWLKECKRILKKMELSGLLEVIIIFLELVSKIQDLGFGY